MRSWNVNNKNQAQFMNKTQINLNQNSLSQTKSNNYQRPIGGRNLQ